MAKTGRPKKAAKAVPVSFRMEGPLHEWWEAEAKRRKTSVGALVKEATETKAARAIASVAAGCKDGTCGHVEHQGRLTDPKDCKHPPNQRIGKACMACGKGQV